MDNLFVMDLESVSCETLQIINNDSQDAQILLSDGITGLGEVLQLIKQDEISPDIVRRIGCMIFMAGTTLKNVTKQQINTKSKLETIK